MSFADEAYIRSAFAMSRGDLGKRMIESERAQGYERIIKAPWLDWSDWTDATIITGDGVRVRLVALEARQPGQGAFGRLIAKIQKANLVPVLVEPNRSLIDWCLRRDWRSRRIGRGRFNHEIWYPRR